MTADDHRIHPLASMLAFCARALSGAQVRWLGSEPSACQRIYLANHTSHLDTVLLWASLPKSVRPFVRPVAAEDYWGNSAVRSYLANRVFHSVLIDRKPGVERTRAEAEAAVDRMAEAMGETYSLIVFPEGTRGSGEEVAAFKSGLYHLAIRKPDAELVPVFIENLNRILPKGEVLPVPLLCSVTFGPPFRLEPGEPRPLFLQRARDAVGHLMSR